MDWLQEYDFSDEQIRSVVGGMMKMSAIDGDIDPQELELIEQVAEGVEGEITLDFGVFDTPESKDQFLYLVTFVAIVDTTINDHESALLGEYVTSLGVSETAQHYIDVVAEQFLRAVFSDSQHLKEWMPKLSQDLRLSDDVTARLMA